MNKDFTTLTPREREVVEVLARAPGKKAVAIADEANIAYATMKTHVGSICAKLECKNRYELNYLLGTVGAELELLLWK